MQKRVWNSKWKEREEVTAGRAGELQVLRERVTSDARMKWR